MSLIPVIQERHHELCLLAQNERGYQNLMLLLSEAYQQGQFLGRPRVQLDWVQAHSDGLIALSGGRARRCRPGPLARP